MRPLILSMLGHAAVLVLVAFTFPQQPGSPVPQRMIFAGEVWQGAVPALKPQRPAIAVEGRLAGAQKRVLASGGEDMFADMRRYAWIKPAALISAVAAKSIPAGSELVSKPVYRDPVLILHPSLPAQLELYFKDRQEVHIELLFNISPDDQGGSLELKRRVSSGNLQADLLSKRYLSHYLFIQRARFAPGQWLPVKIDLSGQGYDTD